MTKPQVGGTDADGDHDGSKGKAAPVASTPPVQQPTVNTPTSGVNTYA